VAGKQCVRVLERSDAFGQDCLPLSLLRCVHHGGFPLHVHGFSEVVFVVRGEGTHLACGTRRRLSPGDAFVMHPGQPHGYADTAGLELCNVAFIAQELSLPTLGIEPLPGYHALFVQGPNSLSYHAQPTVLQLVGDDLTRVSTLLHDLEEALRQPRPGRALRATACFMLLVAELCAHWAQVSRRQVGAVTGLESVVSYVAQRCSEPITLADMASVACLSTRSLNRVFRAHFGCSPIAYVMQVRIGAAAGLLQDRRFTISELAYRCGFADSSYFTRCFRAATGMSPAEFRLHRQSDEAEDTPEAE
jgi:AraC-like DNA-binding protein